MFSYSTYWSNDKKLRLIYIYTTYIQVVKAAAQLTQLIYYQCKAFSIPRKRMVKQTIIIKAHIKPNTQAGACLRVNHMSINKAMQR